MGVWSELRSAAMPYVVSIVWCVEIPLTLIVIPGLTRNPVFLGWIPAFAGMTASELM